MRHKFLKWAKNYHKWPALIISLFLILFSISGIVMNHRKLFSGINVDRKYLPEVYQLRNWNLASIRSQVTMKNGNRLLYGNIGIWLTDSLYSGFTDFNSGLGKGMDSRKTRIVTETPGGTLLAGTFFGLFEYRYPEQKWIRVPLGSGNERIQDIICNGNRILVITRSEIVVFPDNPGLKHHEVIKLKAPEGYDNKMSLFRFAWITHSGEIAGMAGKLYMDALALIIIFLVCTGLIYFFIPKLFRKKGTEYSGTVDFRRKNLRLHNKSGAWFIVFLLGVPLTGMFLRPPFLITIANSRIPVLPLKTTGSNNPWEDKLRAAAWSPGMHKFIFSTSEGFYLCDSTFSGSPKRPSSEPPVSVMGLNVFEYAGDGFFYTGSFDGLFAWNPETGYIHDLQNNQGNTQGRRSRSISSGNLVSGMILTGKEPVVLDYDQGATGAGKSLFPGMPEDIIKNSPMALWNVAQEIHTGRIYQPFLGPFYILIVPLIALMTIVVLLTGYIRWRKVFRKNKQKPQLSDSGN